MEGKVAPRNKKGDDPDNKSGIADLLAQIVRLIIAVIDTLSR